LAADGVTYKHDLIIDRGKIRKRTKAASRLTPDHYGARGGSNLMNLPGAAARAISLACGAPFTAACLTSQDSASPMKHPAFRVRTAASPNRSRHPQVHHRLEQEPQHGSGRTK
jgi:hypothetical protein